MINSAGICYMAHGLRTAGALTENGRTDTQTDRRRGSVAISQAIVFGDVTCSGETMYLRPRKLRSLQNEMQQTYVTASYDTHVKLKVPPVYQYILFLNKSLVEV